MPPQRIVTPNPTGRAGPLGAEAGFGDGVTKEFLTELSKTAFSELYGMFLATPDKPTPPPLKADRPSPPPPPAVGAFYATP